MKKKHLAFVLAGAAALCFTFGATACSEQEWYTVSFTGEGITVPQQKVLGGEKASTPYVPERAGFVFDGWYVGNTPYSFESAVTSELTLTAKWTAIPGKGEGAGSVEEPVVISNGEELVAFAERVKSGSALYAELDADIIAPKEFEGIGSELKPFKGGFNGNGHGIYGLRVPLFSATEGAVIENFIVSGELVSAQQSAGGVIAVAKEGTVVSRISSHLDINYKAGTTGGIVGETQGKVVVEYCSFRGSNCAGYAGGIVGKLLSGGVVIECLTEGTVEGTVAGGVAAYKGMNAYAYDCYVNSAVYAREKVGYSVGIASNVAEATYQYVVNCHYGADASLSGIGKYDPQVTSCGEKLLSGDPEWNSGYITAEGVQHGAVEKAATVTITVNASVAGATEGKLTHAYHEGFEKEPVKEDGKLFAGWYYDEAFTMPYTSAVPVVENIKLYARYISLAAYNMAWENAEGVLNLSDYTLTGAQFTNKPYVGNGTYLLYTKGEESYRAFIGTYDCAGGYDGYFVLEKAGVKTAETAPEENGGIVEETYGAEVKYTAPHKSFVGGWQIESNVLLLSDRYAENGELEMSYLGLPFTYRARVELLPSGASAVTAYCSRLNLGVQFDENGLYSVVGSEKTYFNPSSRHMSGVWLNEGGTSLSVDASDETVIYGNSLDIKYTTDSDEFGTYIAFTVGDRNFTFRYDGYTAVLTQGDNAQNYLPYNYDGFIGVWFTADRETNYRISRTLEGATIAVNGGDAQKLAATVQDGKIVFTAMINSKEEVIRCLAGGFLSVGEETVYNRRKMDAFVDVYTDHNAEYFFDSDYKITYVPNDGGSYEAEGEFLMAERNGVPVYGYRFEMNGTVYTATLLSENPKWLLLSSEEKNFVVFDESMVETSFAVFDLNDDVWSNGGTKRGANPTISTLNLDRSGDAISLDGVSSITYTYGYDFALEAVAIFFRDPRVASGSGEALEVVYADGAVLLYTVENGAKELLDSYIPGEEVAKFVGSFALTSVKGYRYIIYSEDGVFSLSTDVADGESTKIEEKVYRKVTFSAKGGDWYLTYCPAEHDPHYTQNETKSVIRYGGHAESVSLDGVNYLKEEITHFVGFYRGEDNSIVVITNEGELMLNGVLASETKYTSFGENEYEIEAAFAGDEATYWVTLGYYDREFVVIITNGETNDTVAYTRYELDYKGLTTSFVSGADTISFELVTVGDFNTLSVSVNGKGATTAIDYSFSEGGDIQFTFTVNGVKYTVTYKNGTLVAERTYSSLKAAK